MSDARELVVKVEPAPPARPDHTDLIERLLLLAEKHCDIIISDVDQAIDDLIVALLEDMKP